MMRFNYLGESVPSLFDRLRATRVSPGLQTPLLALVTTTLVVAAWWLLERHWYARAQEEFQRAQTRLVEARALRRAAKIERSGIEHLVVLDRQLRMVRSSGSRLGVRIVDIANRVPDRVWLTSLAPAPSGFDVSGRAEGMARLGATIAAIGASSNDKPTLVRATKEERADTPALVTFELHIDE